jgi:hypothetical protein
MSGLAIDRLVLNLPPMSPGDARRVALLVAAGLAQATGVAGAGEVPAMSVNIPAAAPGDLTTLSERIIAGALRQIRRTP